MPRRARALHLHADRLCLALLPLRSCVGHALRPCRRAPLPAPPLAPLQCNATCRVSGYDSVADSASRRSLQQYGTGGSDEGTEQDIGTPDGKGDPFWAPSVIYALVATSPDFANESIVVRTDSILVWSSTSSTTQLRITDLTPGVR